MDLTTALSICAMGLAGLTLLARLLDKSLSIREHEEYRKAVERDISRIETTIRIMDADKPTTGELDAKMDAVKARLDAVERHRQQKGK